MLLSHSLALPWLLLQDKVVNSISELYSFMDGADATLTLKVLGEVDEDGAPREEGHDAAGQFTCLEVVDTLVGTHQLLELVDTASTWLIVSSLP